MSFVFEPIETAALPIVDSEQQYPVRRVLCRS